MLEQLEQIGLSRNEAKVYLALLHLGSTTAGDIIQKTSLHRANVYDSLEKLIKQGLATSILKNKVKYFQPASPSQLLNLFEHRQEELDRKREKIKNLMPKLSAIQSSAKGKEKGMIIEGREGIKIMFEDILASLKKGEEHLILNPAEADKIMRSYLPRYRLRRAKLGIKARFILIDDEKHKQMAKTYLKDPLVKIAFISPEYTSPVAINIYERKVAILLWIEEEPFGILIDNEKIAKGFKNYFELMWKIARK